MQEIVRSSTRNVQIAYTEKNKKQKLKVSGTCILNYNITSSILLPRRHTFLFHGVTKCSRVCSGHKNDQLFTAMIYTIFYTRVRSGYLPIKYPNYCCTYTYNTKSRASFPPRFSFITAYFSHVRPFQGQFGNAECATTTLRRNIDNTEAQQQQ